MRHIRQVIMLEFNELTPRLMDQFIGEGKLPNFARLRRESQSFLTDAGEDPPLLDPWIQWVTVHAGVPYASHRVQFLGDAHRVSTPAIWDCVSGSGSSVWVCGSMNTWRTGETNGAILPDPWSRHEETCAAEFKPYFDFIRTHVLEYTREDVPLTWRSYARFVRFMMAHGLSARTVSALTGQLLRERISPTRWKRAVVLDRLQFDLFRWYYRRYQPTFATYFSNSTAHFQHVYWRNMEPAIFGRQPGAADQAAHEHAVLFGYQGMDRIVGEVFKLAGPDTAIVMLTALSQQPCLKYDSTGGKTYYKPIDYGRLLQFAGIDSKRCSVEPVMSEEFHVRVSDPAYLEDVERRLNSLRVGDRAAVRAARDGSGVVAGCSIFCDLPADAQLTNGQNVVPFSRVFYHVDLTKSGMHDRPGLLWVRIPQMAPKEHREPVDLVDVAPTILSLLQIPAPGYMTGQNLLH